MSALDLRVAGQGGRAAEGTAASGLAGPSEELPQPAANSVSPQNRRRRRSSLHATGGMAGWQSEHRGIRAPSLGQQHLVSPGSSPDGDAGDVSIGGPSATGTRTCAARIALMPRTQIGGDGDSESPRRGQAVTARDGENLARGIA